MEGLILPIDKLNINVKEKYPENDKLFNKETTLLSASCIIEKTEGFDKETNFNFVKKLLDMGATYNTKSCKFNWYESPYRIYNSTNTFSQFTLRITGNHIPLTPLLFACENGHTNVAYLLHNKEPLNQEDFIAFLNKINIRKCTQNHTINLGPYMYLDIVNKHKKSSNTMMCNIIHLLVWALAPQQNTFESVTRSGDTETQSNKRQRRI